jgi:L-alanine-DL-glutamate epimerase-like enolase superfamily enzyme
VAVERWPLAAPFTIARGEKREAAVVVVTLGEGGARGRGEAVPYARYGESVDGVVAAVRAAAPAVTRRLAEAGGAPIPARIAHAVAELSPGAARNAIELALWDREAKRAGRPVGALAGLPPPRPVASAYTLPIRDPETTRRLAARERDRPLLKLKVGAAGDDLERVRAARAGAPDARLIVDANEGWDRPTLERLAPALAALGVELIEQPLPAQDDGALATFDSPVPICADESFHGEPAALDALAGRYGAVNVKLDKQGGLGPALAAVRRARALGLSVMLGTMVATSLAVAPAVLLAPAADWADLDAPLFLARDRAPGLRFEGSTVHPPERALWG